MAALSISRCHMTNEEVFRGFRHEEVTETAYEQRQRQNDQAPLFIELQSRVRNSPRPETPQDGSEDNVRREADDDRKIKAPRSEGA